MAPGPGEGEGGVFVSGYVLRISSLDCLIVLFRFFIVPGISK